MGPGLVRTLSGNESVRTRSGPTHVKSEPVLDCMLLGPGGYAEDGRAGWKGRRLLMEISRAGIEPTQEPGKVFQASREHMGNAIGLL